MAKIHLKLANGDEEHVVVDDAVVTQELQNLLDHTGRFAQPWIQVHAAGSELKYVRYEQIVQVYAFP